MVLPNRGAIPNVTTDKSDEFYRNHNRAPDQLPRIVS